MCVKNMESDLERIKYLNGVENWAVWKFQLDIFCFKEPI